MNLRYPTISRPLFKEKVVVKDNTKKKTVKNRNSLKKIAKIRNDAGIVNNANQHITQDIVDFINWLGDVMDEIRYNDVVITVNQKDNKSKINPRRENRRIARENARKRKSIMQRPFKISLEQEYEIAKDDNLKQMVDRIEKDDWSRQNDKNIAKLCTFSWVLSRKGKYINLNSMINEFLEEEKQKEFNKNIELQDIADWVISARIKPAQKQNQEDIDYNEIYESSRCNMRAVINAFNNRHK